MNAGFKRSHYGLQKIAICLAFIAFLTAIKCHALGLPPVLSVPPSDTTVQSGGTANLQTTALISLTPIEFRWFLNGKEIKNANVSNVTVPIVGTTSTLTITNASATNAGVYTVKIENGGGELTTSGATLTVLNSIPATNAPATNVVVAILPTGTTMTSGGFQLQLAKPANSNCVIDASADLVNWTPIYTNGGPSTSISYLDTVATNLTFRYYRARLQ